MRKVRLNIDQYSEMQAEVDRCRAASVNGAPGMLLAQICTGPETGSMNVFFIPKPVAIEIQKVMAKYSKTPVLPGTTKFHDSP